jgi:tetratricopeptide (TPR) repeat protein
VAADAGRLREALGVLDHLSLVDYHADKQAFSVHRLVQAAARDVLGNASAEWTANAVAAANAAFPYVEFDSWTQCERLVAHARAVAALTDNELGVPLGRLLNQTGIYLRERATYAEPVAHFERSSAVLEKALGPDHPDVGTSLNNLASLYRAQGEYDAAEPLFRRDLAIGEKALGPDHPDVAITLVNLAELLAGTGKLDEAEAMARRALNIFCAKLGEAHPHSERA